MLRRLPLFVCCALFIALSARGAQRTFVSAGSGDDANLCTRQAPCRNFAAAVALTDTGGEVVALDSGGYGPVNVTKSVAIVSPTGVHAALTAFSGSGITVSADFTGSVILRGLYLNGLGASYGIDATAFNHLHIEHCVVSGFATYGIYDHPSTPAGRLFVIDTTVRETLGSAIQIIGNPMTRATVQSTMMTGNVHGIYVETANVAVRGSVASGASGVGFWSSIGGVLTVDDSEASYGTGADASNGGTLVISRSTLAANTGHGIYAFGTGSVAYVSDCTISGNATGVGFVPPAAVNSRGNNTLRANTTDGSFTGTYTAN